MNNTALFQDIRAYMVWAFKVNEMHINSCGMMSGGKNQNCAPMLRSELWIDYITDINNINRGLPKAQKIQMYKKDDFKEVFELAEQLFFKEQKNKIFNNINIKNPVVFNFEARKLIEILTGRVIGSKENDISTAVLLQSIWCVKRKLLSLDVCDHVMLILYSPIQGIGKTEFVKKLMSPMEHLQKFLSLGEVTDTRFQSCMKDIYMGCCDEMGNAERTNIDILKNVISAKHLTTRILGLNKQQTFEQNVTFVGASNKPIYDMIYDVTGLRRFWQLEVRKDLPSFWKDLEKIDILDIWRNVDVNITKGYIKPYLVEMESIRSPQQSRDPIMYFLEECNLKVTDTFKTTHISSGILFSAYQIWCGDAAIKNPLNKITFGRKLVQLGFLDKTKDKVRGFTVNQDYTLCNKELIK